MIKNRKGIILAGGSGSRLYPITKSISKQILPVYDKPMIYYPLSTLMLSDIKDILIISTPSDIDLFKILLKDGSQWGLNIQYAVQPNPDGLAQAFIIGREFISNAPSVLILGDNIFCGNEINKKLIKASNLKEGATIFAYEVDKPQDYGVVEFDDNKKILNIEEKPKYPKSNLAVTGLYYFDNQVCDFASELKPSKRGELEITDINNLYINKGQMKLDILDRGFAWFDAGTHDTLLEASSYIASIQKRQGLKIACLEEIAYKKKWIDYSQFEKQANSLKKSSYGEYLLKTIRKLK